jgi:protein-S-isoprenylcysteine O-methyltransferase Ste14
MNFIRTEYLIYHFYFLLFWLHHIGFATKAVRGFMEARLGFQLNRVLYNLGSLFLFANFMLYGTIASKKFPELFAPTWYTNRLVCLMQISTFFFIYAWYQVGPSILGLTKEPIGKPYVEDGVYGITRHPQYVTIFSFFIGHFFAQRTVFYLSFLAALAIYTRIGIYFEEKKLVADSNGEYLEYKARVPAIPFTKWVDFKKLNINWGVMLLLLGGYILIAVLHNPVLKPLAYTFTDWFAFLFKSLWGVPI